MVDNAGPADPLFVFTAQVRQFGTDRDWTQFHDAKNLSMALSAEVGELVALFQWLTPEQAQRVRDDAARFRKVEDEIADVFIYLVRMADVLGVDLVAAGTAKVERNSERYPLELSKGSAVKYDELSPGEDPYL